MTQQNLIITSYNIHKGMSPLNRKVILAPLANALKTLNTDILCLQEVQGQNQKNTKKFKEFITEPQHEWLAEYLTCHHSYGKNCQYPHGHHGNATLSRHPLIVKQNLNISVNRLEKRGLLHCEILPHGWDTAISVLNVHLNLQESNRNKQYQEIYHYIQDNIDQQKPIILAGDFNDWQKLSCEKLAKKLGFSEVFQQYYNKLLPTFPAVFPILSLDRIYIKNLTVKKAWVNDDKVFKQLSDHLPISAELSLISKNLT